MTTDTTLETMEVEVPPVVAATLTATCESRPEAIARTTGQAMGVVSAFIARHGLSPSGPPRTIYSTYGGVNVTLTVAIPVEQLMARAGEDEVKVVPLPGAHAIRFIHHGPYEGLRDTYANIERWLRERGGIRTDADWADYSPMWEEYLNDPRTTPAAELVTRIYFTLRPPDARTSSPAVRSQPSGG